MSGVYVLKDTETNLLKIGRATNLKERLTNLRTANPRLELVQWFETDDDSTVEAYIHSKLVKHRKSGEFFDVKTVIAISEIELAFSTNSIILINFFWMDLSFIFSKFLAKDLSNSKFILTLAEIEFHF